MDQMVKTEYIVEYPYTKETIENWIKHPVSSWAKVLRALRLSLGVAALVCGVSLSVYAVATAVRKNLYVNALIAAAIFILLGIFSLTAPKRSAKHTIKQQKRFQAADGWRIQFEFGESLHISSGNQSVVYDYTQMGKLTETKDCFFLWLDQKRSIPAAKIGLYKGGPGRFPRFYRAETRPAAKRVVKTVYCKNGTPPFYNLLPACVCRVCRCGRDGTDARSDHRTGKKGVLRAARGQSDANCAGRNGGFCRHFLHR